MDKLIEGFDVERSARSKTAKCSDREIMYSLLAALKLRDRSGLAEVSALLREMSVPSVLDHCMEKMASRPPSASTLSRKQLLFLHHLCEVAW